MGTWGEFACPSPLPALSEVKKHGGAAFILLQDGKAQALYDTGGDVIVLPGIVSQRRRKMKPADKSVEQPEKILMRSEKKGSC